MILNLLIKYKKYIVLSIFTIAIGGILSYMYISISPKNSIIREKDMTGSQQIIDQNSGEQEIQPIKQSSDFEGFFNVCKSGKSIIFSEEDNIPNYMEGSIRLNEVTKSSNYTEYTILGTKDNGCQMKYSLYDDVYTQSNGKQGYYQDMTCIYNHSLSLEEAEADLMRNDFITCSGELAELYKSNNPSKFENSSSEMISAASDVKRIADLTWIAGGLSTYYSDNQKLPVNLQVLKGNYISEIPTEIKGDKNNSKNYDPTFNLDYYYSPIKNGEKEQSFILMAKTETLGGSNWIDIGNYYNDTSKSFANTQKADITSRICKKITYGNINSLVNCTITNDTTGNSLLRKILLSE